MVRDWVSDSKNRRTWRDCHHQGEKKTTLLIRTYGRYTVNLERDEPNRVGLFTDCKLRLQNESDICLSVY